MNVGEQFTMKAVSGVWSSVNLWNGKKRGENSKRTILCRIFFFKSFHSAAETLNRADFCKHKRAFLHRLFKFLSPSPTYKDNWNGKVSTGCQAPRLCNLEVLKTFFSAFSAGMTLLVARPARLMIKSCSRLDVLTDSCALFLCARRKYQRNGNWMIFLVTRSLLTSLPLTCFSS